MDALGHVVAFNEDAGDRGGVVGDRLVDKIDKPLLDGTPWLSLKRHGHGKSPERLASREHLVKQFEEALALDFGKRHPHRLSDDVAAVADELQIGGVDDLEDVLGARAART
jgi:hypothetical protein